MKGILSSDIQNTRILGGGSSINSEAFEFLSKISSTSKQDEKYCDWTTAHPISEPSESVINTVHNTSFLRKEIMTLNGHPILRKSLLEYFHSKEIKCTDENIIVGTGIFAILDQIYDILEIKDKNQSALITTPIFGFYQNQCEQKGIEVEFLETKKETNWSINTIELDKKLSNNPNIKLLILNYPNNPTGKILDKDEMLAIADVVKKYPDLLVLSDEILIDMSLDPEKKPISFRSIEEISDQVIVLNGVSKSRGLGGLRISFAVTNQNIASKYNYVNSGSSIVSDIMAATAIEDTEENRNYLEQNRQKYLNNISKIKEEIDILNTELSKKLAEDHKVFVRPYNENPESGNFLLLDFSELKGMSLQDDKILLTGLDIARFIHEEANIGSVPGECSFISEDEMVIRINTSNSHEDLTRGFSQITQAFLKNIKPKINNMSGEKSSPINSNKRQYSESEGEQEEEIKKPRTSTSNALSTKLLEKTQNNDRES